MGEPEGSGTPLQYSCLENPMDGGAWKAAVHGVAKSGTRLSDFTFTHWRRKWQPTPVFLPGGSQGRGSLVGCVYGVAQSRTRRKRLSSWATGRSRLMALCCFCLVYRVKVCDNPVYSKSISAIFNSICVSASYSGHSCNILNPPPAIRLRIPKGSGDA